MPFEAKYVVQYIDMLNQIINIWRITIKISICCKQLYGWVMSQKLAVNDFEWEENIHKFNEEFIKNYDENGSEGYILEVDVEYPKNVFSGIEFNLHSNLPFPPEWNKIKKRNKFICNLQDKDNYVVHIRALKQALNRG